MTRLKPINVHYSYRRQGDLAYIKSNIMQIAWKRLYARQRERMQNIAIRAGVWNVLFPIAQLEDDLDDAKREIKRRAPCCFVCRRKL